MPQAIEVGELAKAFTREKLAEPFTVFTRMSDAMGRSKIERVYAFVQTKEGDLGEQLVRNGLACVYGAKAVPPGFSSSRPELEKLQQFANDARQDEIGGWGITVGRLNVRVQESSPNGIPAFTVFVPPEEAGTARFDINTATEEQLKTIPGVGAVMARRIIDARPFESADDLKKVNGIGNKKFEKIRPYFE